MAADQVASEQAYYIEKHELQVDSDEDFQYETVPLEEDFASIAEEDLDTALRVINEAKGDFEAIHVSRSSGTKNEKNTKNKLNQSKLNCHCINNKAGKNNNIATT